MLDVKKDVTELLTVRLEEVLLLLRGHLLPRHLAALRGLEFGRGLGQLRVVPGRLRVVAGGLRSRVSISQVPQIHAMNFRFSDETCTYMCVALCGERMYY